MKFRISIVFFALLATAFVACGESSSRECTNNQACDSGEICINHVCVATSGGWQEPDKLDPKEFPEYWEAINNTDTSVPTDVNCNDNNVCTRDWYNGNECAHDNINLLGCNDNDIKTAGDFCWEGACVGVAYECDDNLSCTEDSWNGDGTCGHELVGNACLIDNKCYADGASNPANDCQICDTASLEAWTNAAADTTCDDNNALTVNDACNNRGECIGTAVACAADSDCDDSLDCTDNTCNDSNTCEFAIVADTCLIAGVCYATDAPNPENTCLICNSATADDAWSNAIDNTTCDDANEGTINDVCTAGVCAGEVPECMENTDCDDSLDCTTDTCVNNACDFALDAGNCLIEAVCYTANDANPANDCQICDSIVATDAWTNAANTTTCDDGDDGTVNDICTDGVCAGEVPECTGNGDCNDNIDCTTDTCENFVCEYALDADTCLIEGVCYTDAAYDPANTCQVCDSASVTDAWTIVANDTPCDDSNPCSENDVCADGVCVGTLYDCNDDVPCTQDICIGDGTCSNELMPGHCYIDMACYNDTDRNPNNDCEACVPASDTLDWSVLSDETDCQTNDGRAGMCFSGTCQMP